MSCTKQTIPDQQTNPPDVHINRISLGGKSNSYIISESGDYKFETTKVSGIEITNIDSAEWLWMSKNSIPIISNVSYENGEINFTASGTEGNAVIAALDAKQEIIWSWHIWVTDTPQTMEYENGSIFMDRMLGATSAKRGSNNENYGLFYQWGRKDPFYGGSLDEEKTGPFSTAKKETTVNPVFEKNWEFRNNRTDISTAIKEPMCYFIGVSGEQLDWLSTPDESLWDKTNKTDYDPCPAGYRVPSAEEISSLKKIEAELDENDYAKEFWYTWNGNTTYYPSYGCRDNKGELVKQGGVFLWTSSQHKESPAYSVRIVCWGFFTDINGMGGRGTGNNIRCLAEKS